MRGKLAKLRIKNFKNCRAICSFTTHLSDTNAGDTNDIVIQNLKDLGAFNYGEIPYKFATRMMKKVVTLENESKYEGQWDPKTKQRDGMGVQIWPDGKLINWS